MSDNYNFILAWSFPEDPGFFDFLRKQRGSCTILPLSYSAWRTAHHWWDSKQILDIGQLISAEVRNELYTSEVELLQQLWDLIVENPKTPWLMGLQFQQCRYIFYAALFWNQLVAQLKNRSANPCFFHYAPFSRGALAGSILCSADVLDSILSREQRRSTGKWRNSVKRLGVLFHAVGGWYVNRYARWGIASNFPPMRCPPCEVVLCGLQDHDILAQKSMAEHLTDYYSTRARWILPSHKRLPLSFDEQRVTSGCEAQPSALMLPIDENGYISGNKWRWANLQSWSQRGVRGQLASLYKRLFDATPFHPLSDELAEITVRYQPDLRLQYHAINEFFNQLSPKAVIANANSDLLSFVRAWTLVNNREYIRLPHGIEYEVSRSFLWDAELVGLTGSYYVKKAAGVSPKKSVRLFVAGGDYLVTQGPQAACRLPPLSTPHACFLAVGFNLPAFPDSFSEMEGDYKGLAGVVSRMGGQLRIRCHPRHQTSYFLHAQMIPDLISAGYALMMSNPSESLNEELRQVAVAIIRNWSGAAVQALLAGVPLIGWLPRPGHPESDEIVNLLPLRAKTPSEVEAIIGRWLRDHAYRQEVLRLQAAFLHDQIGDPRKDYASLTISEIERHLSAQS